MCWLEYQASWVSFFLVRCVIFYSLRWVFFSSHGLCVGYSNLTPVIVKTECGGGHWEVISRPGGSEGRVGGEAGGGEKPAMGPWPQLFLLCPPFWVLIYFVDLLDFALLMIFWLPVLLSRCTLFSFFHTVAPLPLFPSIQVHVLLWDRIQSRPSSLSSGELVQSALNSWPSCILLCKECGRTLIKLGFPHKIKPLLWKA